MMSWQSYALTVVLQVTSISAVALVLARLNRRRPTTTHALGVTAIFLVLSSPLLTLALPAQTWWRTRRTTHVAGEEQPRPQVVPLPFDEPDPAHFGPSEVPLAAEEPVQTAEAAVENATQEVERPPSVAANTRPTIQFDWDSIACLLAGVWLTGSAWLAGRWCYQNWQIRRMLRALTGATPTAGNCSERWRSLTTEVCETVGLQAFPMVMVSGLIPMPLVWGVRRPVIVIPHTLLQAGCEAKLRDILIHEAAHIARCDIWMCIVQQLAGVLWWWHPGVRWLNRAVNRSREEICDNFVLTRGNAADYAQTLLDLAEHCSGANRPVPSLGLFEPRWTLETRIKGLLNPKRNVMTRTSQRTVATVALLFTALCLLIGGIRAGENDQKPTEVAKEETSKAPDAEPLAPGDSDVGLHKVILRGKCLSDEEQPLAGVRVIVLRLSKDYREVIAGETKSGANGEYELRDVETALLERGDLRIIAALRGYATGFASLRNPESGVITKDVKLASNPGTLSGIVRDEQGRPVPGVTVFLRCSLGGPIPGICSAVTDARGRYAITDLNRWNAASTERFDRKTGLGTVTAGCFFWLQHPDYPQSKALYSAVPQDVDVTLYPPAVVEGQVWDAVAEKPASGITVSAQGIARHESYRTTTDADGRYRLRMTCDHYNIWADADDRVAIAAKAIKAERAKSVTGVEIRLVGGGFVVGTVFGLDEKPVSRSNAPSAQVAARPRSGAGVTRTPVRADGTYRLRVAPGANRVYYFNDPAFAKDITVEEGQEVRFDIHVGARPRDEFFGEDADQRLARKLREAARLEDAEDEARALGKPIPPKPTPRKRAATPAGKLLDELAEQNASNDCFHDVWCQTMKDIVELGPAAVPELVAELDATENNRMRCCLGFMLRAIGDKRAVPALIRAIPKTLVSPVGSDVGLKAKDEKLAAFMQKHDLSDRDEGFQYSFGRSVREVFGALNKLTGQSFGEEELFQVFTDGSPLQVQLKRELFYRMARKWADWWEQHWSEYVQDGTYSRVHLQPALEQHVPGVSPGQHLKTNVAYSNCSLEPYSNPGSQNILLDLDTGRYATLPERWRNSPSIAAHFDELEAWAIQEGFDLMGTEYTSPGDSQRYCALRPIGLQAWELGQERWETRFEDTTFKALQAEATAASGLMLHYDRAQNRIVPQVRSSFLYRTREGTPGLLYVGAATAEDKEEPHAGSKRDPAAIRRVRHFVWMPLEPLPE